MSDPARPNILFITTDQHHWSAMGYRNPEVRTPNLDRLVQQGSRARKGFQHKVHNQGNFFIRL